MPRKIRPTPDLIRKRFVLDRSRHVWYAPENRFEIINGEANWGAPAFFVCGDKPEGVVGCVQKTSVGGTSSKFGHAGLKFAEDGYNTHVNLAPGYSLELRWGHIDGAQGAIRVESEAGKSGEVPYAFDSPYCR